MRTLNLQSNSNTDNRRELTGVDIFSIKRNELQAETSNATNDCSISSTEQIMVLSFKSVFLIIEKKKAMGLRG